MIETFSIATSCEHVRVGANGVPLIAGTSMKVIELVTAQAAYGWSPEEMHFQHPSLTLGQIYSALAYYWDHKQEIDAAMERSLDAADKARQEAGPSPVARRLRIQGMLK